MVWIHGGAFINGSGGLYDARWLASRGNIVVVTLNYRLGALGFLAHPALGKPGDVGNYGLADQQAALRWVRDNIAAFGGDPAKVTIAGESAGGMSVCDHLVAPGSAGLFRAAIIQSGPCQAQVALPEAERASLDYARDAGCGDPVSAAECLRALPANKLREPVWYYRFGDDQLSGPITGTDTLPVDPMTAFAKGEAAKVPVLIGTNHDEFTLFVALQYLRLGKDMKPETYPQELSPHSAPTQAPSRRAIHSTGTAAAHRWRTPRRSRTERSPAWPIAWVRHWPRMAPSTPTNSTTATRRHRTRCAPCPFPSVLAIRLSFAISSTSAARRR